MSHENEQYMYFEASEDHCQAYAHHISQELDDKLELDTFGWTTKELYEWCWDADRTIEQLGDDSGFTDEQIRAIDEALPALAECIEGNCSCRTEAISPIVDHLSGPASLFDQTWAIRERNGPVLMLPFETSSAPTYVIERRSDYELIDFEVKGDTGRLIWKLPHSEKRHYDLYQLGPEQLLAYRTLNRITMLPRNDEAWDLVELVTSIYDPIEIKLLGMREADTDRYDSVDELLDETVELTAEFRRLDEGLTEALLTTWELTADELVATVRRLTR